MRPVHRYILRFSPTLDPWQRLDGVRLTPRAFGAGSIHSFKYYFEGDTETDIRTLEELSDWLRSCAYLTDLAQFGLPDVWQRPTEFERRRCGDCDDHALWAWRKLIELGYDAHLFSGLAKGNAFSSEHLWVVIRDPNGDESIVETIAKLKRPMFIPMSVAREYYQPFCSVDAKFNCVCYGGMLLYLRDKHT